MHIASNSFVQKKFFCLERNGSVLSLERDNNNNNNNNNNNLNIFIQDCCFSFKKKKKNCYQCKSCKKLKMKK